MSIVFGWNNFHIKTYTPKELNLTTADTSEYRVEVRQSYFHLFWIPFFGLGKKWAIRKDGKLYELPSAMMEAIRRQNIPVKTPWYTFAGPLLIIVGLAVWGLYEKVEQYNDNSNEEARIKNRSIVLDSLLDNATDKHVITLVGVDGPNYGRVFHLKVEANTKDSIKALLITTGKSEYEAKPAVVEEYLSKYRDNLVEASYAKSFLKKGIARSRAEDFGPGHVAIQLMKEDTGHYQLKNIERYFGPILRDRGTGSYGGNALSMEFTNHGWPSQIIALETVKGNMTWETPLPTELPTVKSFDYPSAYIKASGYTYGSPYTFKMTVQDSSGKKYVYLVEGVNLEKSVKLVEEK